MGIENFTNLYTLLPGSVVGYVMTTETQKANILYYHSKSFHRVGAFATWTDENNYVWDLWGFETVRDLWKHLRAVFGTEHAISLIKQ